TAFAQAALSRSSNSERPDFHLYVDEFQSFATSGFSLILSEARKYGLSLTLAHQYIEQLPKGLRDAVFGNACQSRSKKGPYRGVKLGQLV
ncbi:MAG: TraM recognition domain-containing protein, partial [Alphaproteobacteria bacterium]|nr:TraM recognition domain-containing protein [Alphaproteobacteria bacterium]